MANVKTYSPSLVAFSFGGTIVEEWDSITVEKDYPDFKTIAGIRGKNTRVASKNSAATVTINLVQTSVFNEIFSAILKADRISGDLRMQFLLRDILGKEVFASDEAYVEGMASREYGAEMGTRTWIIRCLSSRENDIGNSTGDGDYFEIDPFSLRNIINL